MFLEQSSSSYDSCYAASISELQAYGWAGLLDKLYDMGGNRVSPKFMERVSSLQGSYVPVDTPPGYAQPPRLHNVSTIRPS